jgi:nucleotide-binding universal stress UspA family protein
MAYRDIQMLADDSPAGAARAAIAADLAAHWGGRLTGLFLKVSFPPDLLTAEGLGYMTSETVETMLDGQARAIDQASARALAQFDSATRAAGVSADWRQLEALGGGDLIARARCADLMVVPPITRTCVAGPQVTATSIAMASGGPVLVTPELSGVVRVGQRILIAWNGSREAARALRDAGPFLARAAEIHVLIIARSDAGETAGEEALRRRLEPYYAKTEYAQDPGHDGTDGQILRRQVKAVGADLVVMGLFGHARLREWALGGVSADLMAAPPAALLIAH